MVNTALGKALGVRSHLNSTIRLADTPKAEIKAKIFGLNAEDGRSERPIDFISMREPKA